MDQTVLCRVLAALGISVGDEPFEPVSSGVAAPGRPAAPPARSSRRRCPRRTRVPHSTRAARFRPARQAGRHGRRRRGGGDRPRPALSWGRLSRSSRKATVRAVGFLLDGIDVENASLPGWISDTYVTAGPHITRGLALTRPTTRPPACNSHASCSTDPTNGPCSTEAPLPHQSKQVIVSPSSVSRGTVTVSVVTLVPSSSLGDDRLADHLCWASATKRRQVSLRVAHEPEIDPHP
jgi:hypothetical protein